MVTAAGCVTFACALYLGLYRPLVSFRDNSMANYETASNELSAVRSLAIELGQQRQPDPAASQSDDPRPLRVIASALARQLGLTLIRIQPDDSGSVSFWFESVASTDLFKWMIELNRDHGAIIDRVDIQKSVEPESVTAQIILKRTE